MKHEFDYTTSPLAFSRVLEACGKIVIRHPKTDSSFWTGTPGRVRLAVEEFFWRSVPLIEEGMSHIMETARSSQDARTLRTYDEILGVIQKPLSDFLAEHEVEDWFHFLAYDLACRAITYLHGVYFEGHVLFWPPHDSVITEGVHLGGDFKCRRELQRIREREIRLAHNGRQIEEAFDRATAGLPRMGNTEISPAEKVRLLRTGLLAIQSIGVLDREGRIVPPPISFTKADLDAALPFFTYQRDVSVHDVLFHYRQCLETEPVEEGYDPFFYAKKGKVLRFLLAHWDTSCEQLCQMNTTTR